MLNHITVWLLMYGVLLEPLKYEIPDWKHWGTRERSYFYRDHIFLLIYREAKKIPYQNIRKRDIEVDPVW